MTFRLSRRAALQALGASAFSAGCSRVEEEDVEDAEGASTEAYELLSRYKKFVIVVMENRSFDHIFGHLSLPESDAGRNGLVAGQFGGRQRGRGPRDVNGFESLDRHANPGSTGSVGIFRPVRDDGKVDYAIGDIDHEWDAVHTQYSYKGVHNAGFVAAHELDLQKAEDQRTCWGTKTSAGADGHELCASPRDPMAFYTKQDTPVYHRLIEEYALCDNWHCALLGPTWPNRYYLYSGECGGQKKNKFGAINITDSATRNSIFGLIEANARSIRAQTPRLWSNAPRGVKEVEENRLCVNFFVDAPLTPLMYMGASAADGIPFIHRLPNFNYGRVFNKPRSCGLDQVTDITSSLFSKIGLPAPSLIGNIINDANLVSNGRTVFATFESLCKWGCLPPVSYIEPAYQLAPGDDHPPHNIKMGQAFIASIYEMLRNSPDWEHTLLVITYDEHGSFYDHVTPQRAEGEKLADFQELGFRVPAIIVGKGIKRGFVDHTRYEHCSVIRTIGERFQFLENGRHFGILFDYANQRVKSAAPIGGGPSGCIAQGSEGSRGGLSLADELKVELCEKEVLTSARLSNGMNELVHAFHGNVPYEAKRIFTNGLLDIFDRMGVARIG